ncbi:MAG TPA: OmpA family protein [Gammaproteobacteria bacterium]
MNKKILVLAMAMPVVMLIGCGTNDTRVATSETVISEQPGVNTEMLLPITSDEIMMAVEAEQSGEHVQVQEQPKETELPITEEVAEIIPLPETLKFHFALNAYELRDDDLDDLRLHAKYLASHPEMRLKIIGHTDKSGSVEYNQRLAMKRADHVAKILVEQGVMPEQISIYSQGESQPIAGLDHAIRDRRVEFEYYSEMQLSDKQVY